MREWVQDGPDWALDDADARWACVSPFGSAHGIRRWDVKVFYDGSERHSYHYRMCLTLEEAKAHAEAVLEQYAPSSNTSDPA